MNAIKVLFVVALTNVNKLNVTTVSVTTNIIIIQLKMKTEDVMK